MKYEIKLKLPSLNDYTKACRTNKYAGATFKKKLEENIGHYLKDMPRYEKPITIHFHWVEGNKRRDYDNIAFAKKFILDSMVKYGKLQDDNRRYLKAFTDTFSYEKEFKVIIEVEE